MSNKYTPTPLFAHDEYITDKESFRIDSAGTRYGDTPNVAINAGTPQMAKFITRAYNAHDKLIHLLIEARSVVQTVDDESHGYIDLLSQIDAALYAAQKA